MHDRTMYTDSGDYTWTNIDPQDTLDGNGPQPEPTAYAYTIRGENITAVPCTPRRHIYDVATFPERLDADIEAMRAEMRSLRAEIATLRADYASLRAVVGDLAETVSILTGPAYIEIGPVMTYPHP